MEAPDWITGALALVAIIVSIVSYRGARKQAREANKAAKQAADAAERSAAADENALELQRAEAEKYMPKWDLQWSFGETYALTNRCGERCEGVHLDSDMRLHNVQVPEVLEDSEGGTFMATGGFGVANWNVDVSWRRSGSDEVWTRSMPLPSRAPKVKKK